MQYEIRYLTTDGKIGYVEWASRPEPKMVRLAMQDIPLAVAKVYRNGESKHDPRDYQWRPVSLEQLWEAYKAAGLEMDAELPKMRQHYAPTA